MTNPQYGYQPMPPPQQAAALPPAPPSVRNVVRLMFVRVAVSILSVILFFAFEHQLRDKIRDAHSGKTPADIDTILNAARVGAIVGAVIFVVLYSLLALQVRKGKGWARIVTIVLAALGVLDILAAFASTATVETRVLGIVAGVIDLAILILLLQRESGQFFAARRYRT